MKCLQCGATKHIRSEPCTEVAIEVKVTRDDIHIVELNSTLRSRLHVACTVMRIKHARGLIRIANATMSPVNLVHRAKLEWASSIHDTQLAIMAPENNRVPHEFDTDWG